MFFLLSLLTFPIYQLLISRNFMNKLPAAMTLTQVMLWKKQKTKKLKPEAFLGSKNSE